MTRFIFALCTLTIALPLCGGEFYVSPDGSDANDGSASAPFATLEKARDAIRAEKSAGKKEPWEVHLAAGTFSLNAPFALSAEDSGTPDAPVVYRGVPGKTILSGGLNLPNWRDENGVWVADLPKVEGKNLYFEQLFVNGRRAVRARFPNALKFFSGIVVQQEEKKVDGRQTFVQRVSSPHFAILKAVPKEELKFAHFIVHHNWNTTRRIILDFDAESNTIVVQGGMMQKHNPWRTTSPCVIENLRPAFDQPGEWFYDGCAGKVYYRPLPDESIETVSFVVPKPGLAQFVTINGTPEVPISDVRFVDVRFEYTDTPRRRATMESACLGPSVSGDLSEPGVSQFDPSQAAFNTDAAIMVDNARRIVFERCEIFHTGEYGMMLKSVNECAVLRCTLRDLGAGGIRLGGGSLATKNVVADCIIQSGGRFHPSGVGVWIGNQTEDNQVIHNDIGDFYYTGVSAGWRWGYQGGHALRNSIEFNIIHDIGQGVLADMGGVYTLGTSHGTRVCNNVIYNVESFGYGGWGLYPDEGSEGILMENNLVYDTMDGSFHQHYGKDNIIRNNIFARNKPNPMRDAPAHQVAVTRVEDHRSIVFERNIIYWNEGTSVGYNTEKVRADIRSNLWWKTTGEVEFKGKSHAEWVEMGKDVGGLTADPLFVDAEKNDFRLKAGSPAQKIGFVPFDYTQAGPRE
ncbi:MAG: right-handed parallel beta-helix repeat-containing protein [Planctomycetia bacterium]|nr:right-handed parallel beta-helix repeat-containing protein [Planctomycetia bacterium]